MIFPKLLREADHNDSGNFIFPFSSPHIPSVTILRQKLNGISNHKVIVYWKHSFRLHILGKHLHCLYFLRGNIILHIPLQQLLFYQLLRYAFEIKIIYIHRSLYCRNSTIAKLRMMLVTSHITTALQLRIFFSAISQWEKPAQRENDCMNLLAWTIKKVRLIETE